MSYIEFKDVHKAFAGNSVLRGMNLAITKGEVMFIIGTSGVGKSVTIKHLIGLLRIDAGEIWFDGARVDQLPEGKLAPLRRRIGMVFQSATLFDSMTLVDNVALPLRIHQKLSGRAALVEAKQRLAQVYMDDYADRFPTVNTFTLADVFGGWDKVQKEQFGDGGVYDRIYKPGQ